MHAVHKMCCKDNMSHNSGSCVRSVAPWITVLSQHTVLIKIAIYYKFTFVWYSTKQGTMLRPISHLVHLYFVCPFFGREKNTDSSAVGLILLAIACYSAFCWGLLLLFHFFFFFLKIVFTPSLASAPDSQSMSATRIHWWLPPQVFFFSLGHCSIPTIVCLI